MEKVIVHDYRIPVTGVARKIIYQFSDVHLNLADELSSEEERLETVDRIGQWLRRRENFAKAYQEPYGPDQQLDVAEHLKNLLATANEDGDALIIAGDLFDHINEAHLRMYEKGFPELKIPYLFACGNHEKVAEIPDHCALAHIKQPVQTLDLGDLVLMAVNDSQRTITRTQIDALTDQLAQNKPIILVMHIPICSENNGPLLNTSPYYHLNYPECPPENLKFIDLIYQNTNRIAAVFAGHLHFLNVCELVPGLTQYVSSQGITGHINRYVIGE